MEARISGRLDHVFVLAGCGHYTTAGYCLRNKFRPVFKIVNGQCKLTMEKIVCASCAKRGIKIAGMVCKDCANLKPYGNEGAMRCRFRRKENVVCEKYKRIK